MQFTVRTTGYFYTDAEKKKLEAIGFKFKAYTPTDQSMEDYSWVIEDHDAKIEFISIQELVEFTKEFGRVIVFKDSIVIYDDYDDYDEYDLNLNEGE